MPDENVHPLYPTDVPDSSSPSYQNTVTQRTGATEYLGDGAYVQLDTQTQETLVYASNGIHVVEVVYLDERSVQRLVNFLRQQGMKIT